MIYKNTIIFSIYKKKYFYYQNNLILKNHYLIF